MMTLSGLLVVVALVFKCHSAWSFVSRVIYYPKSKHQLKSHFHSLLAAAPLLHTHTPILIWHRRKIDRRRSRSRRRRKKKKKKTQNKVDCKAPAHGCAWAKHVQVSKERLLRGIRLPTSVKEADENTVGTGSASITCFWSPVTERTLTQRVKKINTTCRMS